MCGAVGWFRHRCFDQTRQRFAFAQHGAHAQLTSRAKAEGVPLNVSVLTVISKGLGPGNAGHGTPAFDQARSAAAANTSTVDPAEPRSAKSSSPYFQGKTDDLLMFAKASFLVVP